MKLKLLWWCAGVDAELLQNCRSQKEQHKYDAIGLAILLTTACAILSGGYAFYTIFKNPIHALLLGVFWGLFVFNMDRLIIITTHKEDKFSWQQLGMAITRIIVAVLIAVVVAKPLELKIFEKPILAELAQENAQIALAVQQQINQGMPEIAELKAANQKLEQDLSDKEKNRDLLCDRAMKEAEGISGTGKEGKGPVYEEKQLLCQQQGRELETLKAKTEPILVQNRQRIMQLQAQKDQEVKTVTTARKQADDIMTQLNTLEKIAQKNPAIAHASHAISWLFIVVDTAPIFAKLIAKRGSYDAMLQQKEYEQIQRADEDRKYFPIQLKNDQEKERKFYDDTLGEAYKSEPMKKVQEELIEEITNRTRKKYIPRKKVSPFPFFFTS